MKFGDRQLIISDLQIPFEAQRALEFCLYVQKQFRIPKDQILCVGDEVDQYFGSLYLKDPDASHNATSEIKETKEKLKQWADAFPTMFIAESNHGQRWAKRAAEAQIPSQMMRRYQDVLETPATWRWAEKWLIECKKRSYLMTHGIECSGKTPYRGWAEINSFSTVFGHLTSPGICHIKTDVKRWSMCVSCLIDLDSYAFHYGKYNKFKPVRGVGVVIDAGTFPIWVPYDC